MAIQHVARRPECRHHTELNADAAPGEAHDADEAGALGNHLGVARHEERYDVGGEQKGYDPDQRQNADPTEVPKRAIRDARWILPAPIF